MSTMFRPDSGAGDPLLPGLVIGLRGHRQTHEGQHLSKQSHYVGILLSLNIYSELDVQFQISGRHHLKTKWASQPGSSTRGPWRWDTMDCNLISVLMLSICCVLCLMSDLTMSRISRETGPRPRVLVTRGCQWGEPTGNIVTRPGQWQQFHETEYFTAKSDLR